MRCGTRQWSQWNQARSRVKVGISDVFLDGYDKVGTNHGTSLLVEGKSVWWYIAIQPSRRILLPSH